MSAIIEDDFALSWTETEGIITYFREENQKQLSFKIDSEYIKEQNIYYLDDGTKSIENIGVYKINKETPRDVLCDYVRSFIINEKDREFVDEDFKYLINNGYIVIGKHYWVKRNTSGEVTDFGPVKGVKIEFCAKALPNNYRYLKVDNITLKTYKDGSRKVVYN